MQFLLISYILLHCSLVLLSFTRIRNSKSRLEFIYILGTPFGAFVWEDLLILSAFNIVAATVVLMGNDIRVGLLFAGVFWIVRSVGETLYYFLQQFLRPKHHPHDIYLHGHFNIFQPIFGDISEQKYFIMMQVYLQTVTVLSTVGVILLLKFWNTLPSAF